MNELQRTVADFVAQHHLETTLEHRLLDLVAEVGELSKEVLKGSSYGRQPFTPTGSWADELGDVLFSLLCVANTSGIDAEEALHRALDKYRRRLEASRSPGSGN